MCCIIYNERLEIVLIFILHRLGESFQIAKLVTPHADCSPPWIADKSYGGPILIEEKFGSSPIISQPISIILDSTRSKIIIVVPALS